MLEVQAKFPDKRVKFGRYNVDKNRGLINYLNVWPIPHIFYFPLRFKSSDSIQGYDKVFTEEAMT